MNKEKSKTNNLLDRNRSLKIIGTSLLISLTIHVSSLSIIPELFERKHNPRQKNEPLRIKIISQSNEKTKTKKPNAQKILETNQDETIAPNKADFLGHKNHKAIKEKKIARKLTPQKKGLDPSRARKKSKKISKEISVQKKDIQKTKTLPKLAIENASKKFKRPTNYVTRTPYEKLLSKSLGQMNSEINAGYEEYLDDEIEEGEIVDINTQEYRYIGYFTNMRKAIELVWTYPLAAARRGIHGKVGIKFDILENGLAKNVSVVKSSGHQVLDYAIVDAIKLASPFAPLPQGFEKKPLTVQGTFNYILNNYYTAGR